MLFYHCFLQVVIRKTPLFPLHHISFRLMRFDFVWLIVVVVIVVVVSLQFLLFYSAKTKWKKTEELKESRMDAGKRHILISYQFPNIFYSNLCVFM